MTSKKIKLFQLDDDPIFRLGFITALAAFPDFEVQATANTPSEAIELISQQVPDLIILELGLGWQLYRQLRNKYPNLPIFLLTAKTEPEQLIAAKEYGAKGYCPKGTQITEIVSALRQVASGETYWPKFTVDEDRQVGNRFIWKKKWISRLRESGVKQIQSNLELVSNQLERERLDWFDWLFWSGRYRELVAARWLVDRILPVEVIIVPQQELYPESEEEEKIDSLMALTASGGAIATSEKSGFSVLFDRTLDKIQSDVENLTGVPLEIDILQVDKKRELLYTVLDRVKKVRDELIFLQVNRQQLSERIEIVLQDLWQSSTINFFSKYYVQQDNASEYTLVNILLSNAALVQKEILDRIPWVSELFSYLLFNEPLAVDNVLYRSESPEAIARAEVLMQNLTLQIANGVMQVILNNFSEVEIIKHNLFARQYNSSRDVARFRNDLSRRYRQEKYFEEPKSIFESQYCLFCLRGKQIKKVFFYAPRQEELKQLQGLPWLTTIVLETRDAMAPILRSAIALAGSGLVYLLTQVIGRGIGLIVRGILQGVGNSFQDNGYIKNNQRGKRSRSEV